MQCKCYINQICVGLVKFLIDMLSQNITVHHICIDNHQRNFKYQYIQTTPKCYLPYKSLHGLHQCEIVLGLHIQIIGFV